MPFRLCALMINTIVFDAEGVVFDSELVWDNGQIEYSWTTEASSMNEKNLKTI